MRCLFCLIALLFGSTLSYAQDIENGRPSTNQDSTINTVVLDSTTTKQIRYAERRAFHSALLPGWGQIENKQPAKGALFFAAVGGGLYATIDLSKEFKRYNTAYSSRLQNFTMPQDEFFPALDLTQLLDERQAKRSAKDMATVGTVYFYLVNVIDAAATYQINNSDKVHPPVKAAYYSAVLPGLGQAYNKKYWKIPLVYGALGATGYFAVTNRDQVRKYRTELEYRSVGETTGFRANLSEESLADNLEYWRKWRDFTYIIGGVVYVLNIIDATVDAHLWEYDVSDDLGFQPAPAIERHADGNYYYGINLTFKLPYK